MNVKIRICSPALFINNKMSSSLERVYQDEDYTLWRRDNYFKPKYSDKGPIFYAESHKGIEIFRIEAENADTAEEFIKWVMDREELLFDYCLIQQL